MKRLFYYITILLFIVILTENNSFANSRQQYHSVLSCKMTSGNQITLKVLHITDNKDYFSNGDKPFFEIKRKINLAFTNSIRDDFVGEIYFVQCIKETLIFAMGQVSPYLSGIAIRQNPITHQYERLYFAEKALPHWLYFKNNEWGVIIPNIGYETDKKYLVYTFKSGKNQPELQQKMIPMNHFPVPKKDLIRIPLPKGMQ
ncbi:hypothetical protein [Commensalibacter communis]|uniref:hypothetical protein n=1 Tax=Commensalibacter communis TaxID=2972786 RepID=UPI0022FFBAF7|nr:hypothetical protein [Commensalibacter communis]CAI3959096.1 unnamed protein product [Commensalibacter communis]CAI3959283.1 unnamed protein product [Commensalibacter communis]